MESDLQVQVIGTLQGHPASLLDIYAGSNLRASPPRDIPLPPSRRGRDKGITRSWPKRMAMKGDGRGVEELSVNKERG